VVLNDIFRLVAVADDSGWWLTEFGSSWLLGHSSSEGVPRLLCGSNRMSTGTGVLSSVLVLQWAPKSRSIGSLGGFMDHHMRTCRVFVIRIISARGNGSSGSAHSNRVPCSVALTSIQYLNPRDKILSMPASRFARVGPVSSIPQTCSLVCHWTLAIRAGSGMLGRPSDGRSTQRPTERGPARPAGAVVVYMLY